MCSPLDGRYIARAIRDLEGPVRAELARLWIEYADGLFSGGHTRTARVFAELSLVAAQGTTEVDDVDARFVRIIAADRHPSAT